VVDLKYRRDHDLQAAMLEVGRLLWAREFIAGTDGNFSARMDDDHILSTPSGLAKGRLTPNDLVVTDLKGTVISGNHRPSSELRIHLAAYRLRPEIGAVVHAHPKTVVALSLASIDAMFTALPETVVALGLIGSVPYETPGSPALASEMESALENHDAIVMERHGAITLGRNLFEAYERMETLEHAAQTLHLAQTLGSVESLPDDEIERLLALGH